MEPSLRYPDPSLPIVEPVTVPVAGTASAFTVRRIYCVGRNYLDHIKEMKEADERDPPFFFQKPTDAIVEDKATIPYPEFTDDFQYEVELVVAIGKGGRAISSPSAIGHIFGHAVGIDLTRRDRQRDARDRAQPWEMGKSFDHSAPCGSIHLIAFTGPISHGRISLKLNGIERQKGDIRQMIWSVPEIISNLSMQYELRPGDLIFTGTPAGVGPIAPGDKLEAEIEGLGKLTVMVGTKHQA